MHVSKTQGVRYKLPVEHVVIRDSGFVPDDLAITLAIGEALSMRLSELQAGALSHVQAQKVLHVDTSVPVDEIIPFLGQLGAIVIEVPSFSDGRGFSMATQLRRAGFKGRLRAQGHVIADQYVMARRCGFDEVAIDGSLAARQPEHQWTSRVAFINTTYQNRLQQAAVAV